MVTPTVLIGILAVLFVLILGVVFALVQDTGKSDAVADRLGRAQSQVGGDVGAVTLRKEAAAAGLLKQRGMGGFWLPAPEGFIQNFRPELVRAGYHRPEHVNVFFTIIIAGAVLGLPLAIGLMNVLPIPESLKVTWYVLGPFLGLYIPVIVLRRKIKARQRQITESLPDALDLMVICLEVGIGIEQAMTRVGEELVRRKQPLGEELVLTSLQIDAGRARNQALRAFALRVDTQEVRSLVTMLVQTEKLGTGVAQALRTASDTIRTRRMQRAEAEAAKTSVKMIFPLVLFMLPATFVVLLGPSFMDFKSGISALGGP